MAEKKKKKPAKPKADPADALEPGEIVDITADSGEDKTDSDAAETEIEALMAERDDLREKFMRALADSENTRKRAERERREAEHFGGTKLARDLLPVYDNLSRALDAATDEMRKKSSALLEGVELTMREILTAFKKHEIELIEPKVGDKFDPLLHQAMFEAPAPDTTAGDIIQVSLPGFMIRDRLLRPAQVGVSSTPASKGPSTRKAG